MSICAPTLSTRGWAKTNEAIIDTILTHYISNNPSQSYTYVNQIYSLQAAIKNGGGIMSRIADNVKHDLSTVFNRYFPNGADIDCTYNIIGGNDSQINLNISGTITTSTNDTISIVKSLENINSKFFDIAQIKIV